MGSKSQVRSMQRGAAKRDRAPTSKCPDYGGKAPTLRLEDRGHLGLTEEAFDRIAGALKEKVLGYARAGFRKPADVSRLLNKENLRTPGGTEWNPRLVHFLLGRIYGDRAEKLKPRRATSTLRVGRPEAASIKQKLAVKIEVIPQAGVVPLSSDEMARRLDVLKTHLNTDITRRF